MRGQDFDRAGQLKAQRLIEKRFPKKDSDERRDALEALRLEQLAAVHPPYLEGVEAYAYYLDLLLMQTYAQWNRKVGRGAILACFVLCEAWLRARPFRSQDSFSVASSSLDHFRLLERAAHILLRAGSIGEKEEGMSCRPMCAAHERHYVCDAFTPS
jgi:hypothetical protein